MSKNKHSWEYLPPPTNFSKMRRFMLCEDDFAKLLSRYIDCEKCQCAGSCSGDCESTLAEWLKQEV